jgi:hypothetical protein
MKMTAGKIGETLENPLLSQASRLRFTRKFSIGNFRWFFNGVMIKNIEIPPPITLDIIITVQSKCSRPKYWRPLMPDQQIAELATLVSTIESSGVAPNSDSLSKLAAILAKLFGVQADEVAVLKFVPKFNSLKFVIPEKFTPVGTIPLTSTTALASRTARERKPELVNNFSSARHANFFEAVPLGRDPSELIQKIMSAPILEGTEVHGVVQISRKAASPSQAGADFTQKDLRTLASLSSTLDRFLKLCHID